jgi:hypothetical protein
MTSPSSRRRTATSERRARLIVPGDDDRHKPLERRGWIERRTNPDDRRSILVTVTEDGRAMPTSCRRSPWSS